MATEQGITFFAPDLEKRFGLKVTSQRRSAERNAAVGGAKNSDHLTGMALDLAGKPENMAAAAAWARANMGPGKLFRYVEYGTSDHQDHVHLSYNADAGADTRIVESAGTQGATVAAAATAPPVDELPPDSTPEQVEEYIRKNYPNWSWLLTNPELRSVLLRPDIDNLDALEIQALVEDTDYWKTHGQASRAFDYLLATDVGRAVEMIDDSKRMLRNALAVQGIQLDDTELGEVAKKAIRESWDPADINDYVVEHLKGGHVPAGETAQSADQVTALARTYLVPMTRQDAEDWAIRLTEGTASKASLTSWLTGLAKARFASQPDILAAIDGGFTPGQYFGGHVATISNLLEVAPESIDLMDPRWSWAVETVDDKGNRRAPTLGEVAMEARQRPEFGDTRAYKETTAGYALGLQKFMGVAG